MNYKITNALIVLLAAVACVSCLGGSDNDEYTYYDDAAITSFVLGTMNHYTVKSDGTKVKSTYSGSTYKFNIDQANGLIYNTDSLPYGTDAEHVVATIGSLNSGIVFWRNEEDGSYYYYVSSDSVDLTNERHLRVASQSGLYHRDYTLKLNVHQEDGESFAWKSPLAKDAEGNPIALSTFASLEAMKATYFNGKIYIFGNNGSTTKIFATDQTDGANWTELSPNVALSADAYKNIIATEEAILLLNGETLLRSTDGTNWDIVKEATGLKQLAGKTNFYLFALTNNNQMMVSANWGETWQADAVEDGNESSMLATVNGFAFFPLKTNDNMEQITMIGSDNSNNMVGWSKITDLANATEYPWCLIETRREIPQLTGANIINYDSAIMMLGLKDGSATNYLISKDGGINWETNKKYALPAKLTNNVFTTVVDGSNFIWIILGSGEVWKGRLNRLGWEIQ